MRKILLFGLIALVIVSLPFFAGLGSAQGNWWDKWGEPKYGGVLNGRSGFVDILVEPQDPRSSQFGMWFELLFNDHMRVDRTVFSFTTSFTPIEYKAGWLAESWNRKDPKTVVVNIRKGIKWQNKYPVNGREMTAEDVAYSYDRILGKGPFDGQKPNGFFSSLIPSVDRVVATDKYTLEFRLNTASFQAMEEVMGPFLGICIVPPEWVNLPEGERNDWHNIPGTGPFSIDNFQVNVSVSGKRNPDYWGYDPRHPKNKLPYLDEIKVVAIPDVATSIAALRTGKLDELSDARDNPSIAEAQQLAKTNPDIVQFRWPAGARAALFKYGAKPFDDIRVRKALQMAIDIPTIAKSHYLGEGSTTAVGILSDVYGKPWATPFKEWPAALQEEYTYNPEKAKALLAEAGYPNGFTTNIVCSGNDDTTLLQIVKSMWEEIGVKMDINVMDMITHRTFTMQLKYDQMNWGGFTGASNSPGAALGSFWSKKLEKIAGINDPVADEKIEAFYAAETMEEALPLYKDAEMYILGQHYGATVGDRVSPQFCQSWVKGWNGEFFWGAWGWQYRGLMWMDK